MNKATSADGVGAKLDKILFEHRWHAIADFHLAKEGQIPEKTKHQEAAKKAILKVVEAEKRAAYQKGYDDCLKENAFDVKVSEK